MVLRGFSSPAATELFCGSTTGPLPYTLLQKDQQSSDSWLCRFSLPRKYLGDDLALPTCVKVLYPGGTDELGKNKKVLEKSYSPASHPAAEGVMDLVVKAYPYRPGGGVGAYICNLKVGEKMYAKVKAKRLMHGDARVSRRWKKIGLIGGGTGIAPLFQIARILLNDPLERSCLHLLSINRREEDILMRQELEDLASVNLDRFKVGYCLTTPPAGWDGLSGRGSVEMLREVLPPPTGDGTTMILVCGSDGFVETWGGPVGRAPKPANGKKGVKIQGLLQGLLADAGYDASEVFKY